MKKLLNVLLLASLCLVLFNCQSTNNQKVSEHQEQIKEFNTMFGNYSCLQSIVNIMIKSGVAYDSNITVDTLIIPAYYETPEIAALMCGVYSGDALYHSAFGNTDKAFESYTAAQILANHLEIGPFYVEHLIKRYKEGLSEEDSLLLNFDKVLASVDTNISEEERVRIVGSYLIGNIIEKLYLIDKSISTLEGMKISDISPEAGFLYNLLFSEKESIDLFVKVMDKYSHNQGNKLQIELVSLQSAYAELLQDGIPEYEPGDVYIPTEKQKNISAQIENTRNLFLLNKE